MSDASAGIAPNTTLFQALVSSKHLKMASAYFKNMLSGNWKETETSHNTLTLPVPSWYVLPVHVLLHIMHGQYDSIPEKMSFNELAQFTVVVDFYNCVDHVAYFVHRHLAPSALSSLGSYNYLASTRPIVDVVDVALKLYVRKVFRMPDDFSVLTKHLAKETSGAIQAVDLPNFQDLLGKCS
jgi:hypothetical protein